jgi:menaquinone-9 beta-reductase
MMDQQEVIIVGGGPAGLTAAVALRARNFNVTVVDAGQPPVEKVCGEGLLPETLDSLGAIGVKPESLVGVPFGGIRYIASKTQVEAKFPHGHALGIRRSELHRLLLTAATDAGAEFLWKTRVDGLEEDGIHVAGQLMRARWIIGADGHASQMRRWAGLDDGASSQQRFAFRQHFRVKPWTDFLEVHWSRTAQAYVTAVGAEEICVVVMSRDPRLRMRRALNDFPELAGRLRGHAVIDKERGAISRNRVLRRVTKGRVALLGDASGTVDAITGEGLGLAFRQVRALQDAIACGDLHAYEAAHRRLRRKPQFMAKMLLTMDRSFVLQQRAMSVLALRPGVFERLLSVHAGKGSALEIAGAGLKLGWGLLTA